MTRSPRALRWRVTLMTTILGAALSLLFALASVFITEDYEQVLISEILSSEAQDYSLSLALDPRAAMPQSHRLSGYFRARDGSGTVPVELQGLSPGIHEESPGIQPGVTIGVFDIDRGRLYFVMDLGDIEALEQHLTYFLIMVVVLGTGIAAWLGWLFAGMSLAPVRRLAAALDDLPTAPRATAFADENGADELGRLAKAIDNYQSRLVDADMEERRFFADASHELRTPIAVVRGVTEVILDDPDAHEGQRRWLDRLDRGMAELTMLLDTLLGLARRRDFSLEILSGDGLLADSISAAKSSDRQARLHVSIDIDEQWTLPRREAMLVLQGVLRRLTGTAPEGRLDATMDGGQLVLAYTPETPTAGALPLSNDRGDAGTGMTLVNRLATALGWRIEYLGTTDGYRIARISFQP